MTARPGIFAKCAVIFVCYFDTIPHATPSLNIYTYIYIYNIVGADAMDSGIAECLYLTITKSLY